MFFVLAEARFILLCSFKKSYKACGTLNALYGLRIKYFLKSWTKFGWGFTIHWENKIYHPFFFFFKLVETKTELNKS